VNQDLVMTVTGPMTAEELGVTDAHDHLFLRSVALAGHEFDDPERAIAEAREGQASGLHTIVDLTPIGLGRRPDLLRQVSTATGMPIIGATGFHRDAHYADGHWVYAAGEELLLDRMLSDIERGMHPCDWDGDRTLDPARAGVIKAGGSYHHLSAAEARRLAAIAEAGRRTGVAIVAHTEVGTHGHEIVDLLTDRGVAADRVALAHLDRNPDVELHAEIAGRGVYLEYDTVGRTKYHPDSVVLDLIEEMVTRGYANRLLLGLDLGRRDYFRSYGGGPGLRYLMTAFVPRLRLRLGDEVVHRILVANPARAFAIHRSG
jgi:phosphotriesterase-related protein